MLIGLFNGVGKHTVSQKETLYMSPLGVMNSAGLFLSLLVSDFSWCVSTVNSSSHRAKRSYRAPFVCRQALSICRPFPCMRLSLTSQTPDFSCPSEWTCFSKVFSVHITWWNENGSLLLCKIIFNLTTLSQAAILSFHPSHEKLTYSWWTTKQQQKNHQYNELTVWEISNYELHWYSY